ncbi:MAG: sigma-70 region 4 domain-containing protein [Planctomycetota bacterium]
MAGETDGEPDGGAPDPDALADPRSVEPVYRDAGRYERLERALAALPAELREVVVLRRIDGLESKEVAALLGRSDDAVRKAYSRAMARLATLLGDDG